MEKEIQLMGLNGDISKVKRLLCTSSIDTVFGSGELR